MTIKFYSISKDDWQAGDYIVCEECGTHIRHVIEIDGIPYGTDCGSKKVGWTSHKTKKIAKSINWYKERLSYFLEKQNFDRAYIAAQGIIDILHLDIRGTKQDVSEIVLGIVE
jgi:hypothetical protein